MVITSENLKKYFVLLLFYFFYLYIGYIEHYPIFEPNLFSFMILLSLILTLSLVPHISILLLLSLIQFTFIFQYFKEYLNSEAGLWIYLGKTNDVLFGVLAWITAALSMYALRKWLLSKTESSLKIPNRNSSSIFNCLIVIPSILLTLTTSWHQAYLPLQIFTLIVTALAFYFSLKSRLITLIFTMIIAILVSFIGELSGSHFVPIYQFAGTPTFPPLYLVLGYWPIEVLVIFSVSEWVSYEGKHRLNKDG